MPITVLLALLTLPAQQTDDHWPAFRGGDRAGTSTNEKLPAKWDEKTNVAWSVEVPGNGWSSPVVWGGKVFVTTAVTDAKPLVARKGLYITDLKGKLPPGEYAWTVLCYDLATGKELWRRKAFDGKPTGPIHIKNSLASETPVCDGERLYCAFGNVGIACFDFDGKPLWSEKRPPRKTQMGWGTGASPAAHDGKVFLVNDNEEKSYVECLDGRTGKQLWKVDRAEKSNWATPFVWKHAGRAELITAAKERVRSYALDGKPLWELRGMSMVTIPTPFAAHGMLYVTSGYIVDPFIKPLYAIRPGAKGDISLKSGEDSNDHIAWSRTDAGPYHPTPVVYGDYLYMLYDRGFLSCFEAKTGKEVYASKRVGGSAFTASPWAYGGKVFCLSEDGTTAVVKAGPKFELLGRNTLNGMTLATPALAGDRLVIRTQSKLYCLRER